MNKELARLVFADWAHGYSTGSRTTASVKLRAHLTLELPHAYPPLVPVALRGPNWDKR